MKQIFTDKKFLEIFILGIISGMPLSIIFSTLAAWLKEGNIDIAIITTFAIARMPYSLKFLWAPLVDYIKLPFLQKFGHRKAWLILCCSLITIILYSISYINLSNQLYNLYILTIALGVCSATYDISFDAFRIEKLPSNLQGQASSIAVMGYRIGMLITGAFALEISYLLNSWPDTFLILSAIFFISTIYIFSVKEEKIIVREEVKKYSFKSLSSLFIQPFKDFLSREAAFLILGVIILFKMGDAMLGAVAMPFYLELGFTKQQIALVGKAWGLLATLAGGYAGGWIIDRIGTFKGLIITGIIQSLTHFAFIWLYYQGANYPALFIAISVENLGAGMGSSALVAYLSVLCNKKYSATQYAILSSTASFFNNTITIYSGQLVKNMGWISYFIFTVVLALPALILLVYMDKRFGNKENLYNKRYSS